MSVSKVSLVNGALIELGVPVLISLDEDSAAARIANTRFDDLLDQELADHDWSFARARAQLAAESTAPAFGYAYSHVLPASPFCLQVIEEVNDVEFVVEGRRILSDDTPLQIRYTYRVTDYNDLSASFRRAFIHRLAAVMAVPLTGSAKLKAAQEKLYLDRIQAAKGRDSQQGSPKQAFDDSHMGWLNARHTGVD